MEKFACSLLGRVKPIDLLRKSAVALAALLLTAGLPASAQLNLPQNYEYQWRSATKVTKIMAFTVPSQGAPPGPLSAPTQLMGVFGGEIYRQNAALANVTTGATNVTTTIPANYWGKTRLAKDLIVYIKGTTAANGNTKVLNLIFGGTSIALMNNAGNNKDFFFKVEIYNTGVNTQQIAVSGYTNAAFVNALDTTTAVTTTAPITLQLNMPTATGAADISVSSYVVQAES